MNNFIADNAKSDYLIFIFIFIISLLTKILIVDGEFHGYGWDPGNYALATKSYSIFQTRPHWPGYFLHVKVIQFINYYIQDTFKAMIFLSMIYSSLGISFFYLLLRFYLRHHESLLISLILMTNPLVWYYGCVEEMYSFEVLFSVLLVYLSLKNKLIYLTPLLMGLCAGIRPSSVVLLFPLYIYLWYYNYINENFSKKYFVLSQITGIIFLMSWFLPLTNSVGGIYSYFKMFATHSPIQQITFFQNLGQFLIYLSYPMFGVFIVLIFLFVQKLIFKVDIPIKENTNFNKSIKSFKWILIFWIVPPILFFVLIHYSKGTILLCTAGIISIIPFILSKKQYRKSFYVILIIINTVFFLFAKYKLPNVQTYFNQTERNITLFEVLKERLGANYLLSKSNIENMQSEFNIINQILDEFKNNDSEFYSTKKYVFMDPTTTISPRALQAQFPDIALTKISLQNLSIFGKFYNLDLINEKSFKRMLANTIIFSRKDFVDYYLQNIKMNRKNYDQWTVFIPEKTHLNLIENIYVKYFDRSKSK